MVGFINLSVRVAAHALLAVEELPLIHQLLDEFLLALFFDRSVEVVLVLQF